jgi:hypothetical protein
MPSLVDPGSGAEASDQSRGGRYETLLSSSRVGGAAGRGGIASAGADEVESELWLGDGQPGQAEAWRSNGYRSSATQVVFQPLAGTRIETLKRRNSAVGHRRLQVGVSRQLASEATRSDLAGLAWMAVEGGSVALVDIVSPGAKGLRVALKPSSLPPATQIRVASDDGVIHVTSADKAGALVDGYGLFWTAVTAGERQRLEFFMPAGIDTAGTVPDIRAAAHLLVSMGAPGGFPLGAVTLSQPCQINAVCPTTNSVRRTSPHATPWAG